MERVRKAVLAGAAAFFMALIPALVNGDQPASAEGWGALLGGALAGAIATGWAVYKVRNAGTANGSDPVV